MRINNTIFFLEISHRILLRRRLRRLFRGDYDFRMRATHYVPRRLHVYFRKRRLGEVGGSYVIRERRCLIINVDE